MSIETNGGHVMKVTDPVCGMRISPDKAASTVDYKGKTYYFCTDACRTQFEAAPERYVPDSRGE